MYHHFPGCLSSRDIIFQFRQQGILVKVKPKLPTKRWWEKRWLSVSCNHHLFLETKGNIVDFLPRITHHLLRPSHSSWICHSHSFKGIYCTFQCREEKVTLGALNSTAFGLCYTSRIQAVFCTCVTNREQDALVRKHALHISRINNANIKMTVEKNANGKLS